MTGIMRGKIVVITGATSGIGQSTAERLAAKGARIIQIARDRNRGAWAQARLEQIAPTLEHAIHYADLSLMSEVSDVAKTICATEPRIDVLINNAGAIFNTRGLTAEGLERTFALNHMAYFGLTLLLLGRLRDCAPARIINTASDAHAAATLDFDDLQSAVPYGRRDWVTKLRYGGPAYEVYARSKLCNVLFTRALAQRLAGTGVTANSVHPGFVATRFADDAGGLIAFSMRIAKRFARPPSRGAETLVYLASSPEVAGTSGLYFHDRVPASPSPAGLQDVAAERLWQESMQLWEQCSR
jgi:NAD(P)-dependent dehydrogenase (short-subunit alcohol dehydrogenase family)